LHAVWVVDGLDESGHGGGGRFEDADDRGDGEAFDGGWRCDLEHGDDVW